MSLTSGFVCCRMGDKLAIALLELAARQAPPDRIVIEASGVADPRRVAFYGAVHPRLQLNGLRVAADAGTLRARLDDPYVGELVLRQLDSADDIIFSKQDLLDDAERAAVRKFARQARVVEAVRGSVPSELLLRMGQPGPGQGSPREFCRGPVGMAALRNTVSGFPAGAS